MGTSSNLNSYCSRPSPKTRERERNDVIYHTPVGEQTDVNAFTETYAILEASFGSGEKVIISAFLHLMFDFHVRRSR